MSATVLKAIIEFLFGRKYYINVVYTRGTNECGTCYFIFTSKEQANAHIDSLENNVSYGYVETKSFRSRNIYIFDAAIGKCYVIRVPSGRR